MICPAPYLETTESASSLAAYAEFVAKKRKRFGELGFDAGDLHWSLFDFQEATVRWAIRKGRACIFAGTGLGKTLMEVEFARRCAEYTGMPSLILAPLAVAPQVVREARIIDAHVGIFPAIGESGVTVTNYEKLEHVADRAWGAVVLDESSILKSHDGAYRQWLQEAFSDVKFKLACTATPAPNDYMELGTHAEFVGAMTRAEMLATYFTHDGGDTSKWRLKRHAVKDFWKWVSGWAACFFSPDDLGFDGSRFVLPELLIHDHIVESNETFGGSLFGGNVSATSLYKTLQGSADARVAKIVDAVAAHPHEPWVIWCNTNTEQDLIEKAIPGIVSVRGSDSQASKEDRLLGFSDGKYRMIVTKPSIAGFGMNWQHCNHMAFCGLTYSFESFHQAVRRCWRFGQTRPVHVHVVTGDAEAAVKATVEFKRSAFDTMAAQMRQYTKDEVLR